MAALKQQTDALDARAAALDRTTGDFGDSDGHNPVLARLDALNAALAGAESKRMVREAIWRAVESGNPELISSLGGNAGAGSATQNSFALLQTLRSQEAQARAQLAAGANRYGENWPGVAEQKAHLATLEQSITDEVGRLGERAHSDYDVAVREEAAAHAAFDQQRELAAGMTGKAVNLRLARQEADESRSVYASLLGRLEQTGVLEGLHSGNFTVVSPALVPSPDHPTSPNEGLLAALALGVGLTVGCGAAMAREVTDTAIHAAADLEALAEGAVFAEIPAATATPWYRRIALGQKGAELALAASAGAEVWLPVRDAALQESLHYLRASLQIAHSSGAPQVITVAPAEGGQAEACPGDGAATARGLAAVLAQQGARTLFVDADLRSATAAGTGGRRGLSEMVAGSPEASGSDAADAGMDGAGVEAADGLPLLSVIEAGARPPCPAELIGSARMSGLLAAWREHYTFVVIRGPAPVFADGLVLAQQSDAVLVTARAGKTKRAAAAAAWDALSRQVPEHAVLGFILEGADARA